MRLGASGEGRARGRAELRASGAERRTDRGDRADLDAPRDRRGVAGGAGHSLHRPLERLLGGELYAPLSRRWSPDRPSEPSFTQGVYFSFTVTRVIVFAGYVIENRDAFFVLTLAEPVFPASAEFGDHCTYDADVTVWLAISATWPFWSLLSKFATQSVT